MAALLGYTVKLIGYAEVKDDKFIAMVSPRMVPASNPLCRIDGVFNGILVDANMVGEVMFYGPGAGKLPTASAVVADIIDIIANADSDVKPIAWSEACESDTLDFAETESGRVFIIEGDAPKALTDIEERRAEDGSRVAIVTKAISEAEAEKLCDTLGDALVSVYRAL